jgi:hypothetical protein
MAIEGINEKKSQIIYINNKKFKFLYEQNVNSCEYKGEVVLHNRYNNYRNHNFIESRVNIPTMSKIINTQLIGQSKIQSNINIHYTYNYY